MIDNFRKECEMDINMSNGIIQQKKLRQVIISNTSHK